jgi:MFS family permease
MGFLIAGSSAGYAICLLVAGAALNFTTWRGALGVVAALPVISWVLGIYVLRTTPNTVHARPAGESLLASLPAVWHNRRGMLSIWGYTFHNWELLGLWAWLPAFLTAALVFHGHENPAALALSFAALTYVANIAGSIAGGTMADRWGRTQTILTWSCVSLALSFSIGWLIALPLALLVALACLYNFAGIADSSTHSLVLAESVPPHYLGVAYAVRSVIGFGAGVISPVVFGWALDLAGGGNASTDAFAWGIAWMTLGVGAMLGPLATWKLRRLG